MQKKVLQNLIAVCFFGIVAVILLVFTVQTLMACNRAKDTFSAQLDYIVERIQQNEAQIAVRTQAIKADYISRARSLAMMIELDPDIVWDCRRLSEAATALNVDEIHIVDENGILKWGTQPLYYGMDFAATEQTRPFLSILENPELEIAQEPMPNGSAGLMRQYAGVSLRSRKGIAEVGVIPDRYEEALKGNQIGSILSGVVVGNTGYVFSVDAATGIITSHPNENLIGALTPVPLQDTGSMTIDGQKVLYGARNFGGYLLAAVIPENEVYAQRLSYTVLLTLLMLMVFCVMCRIVSIGIKKNVVNGIIDTVGTLEAVSAGNLDVTADVRSCEEFERLSNGINLMLQSIKTKIDETAAVTSDLRRLGAIVAIADAGIIVKDKAGIVLEWNIGAENILGYKPEEIIGKSTKAYAPELAHAGIDEIEKQLKNGDHITHLEVLRKHRAGHMVYCSASYTPILDEFGEFIGSVAIFHNISDKKQIEQALQDAVLSAEQANSAKSSFLANMSHEIRTPLNGIIGFAELANEDENIPENTRDYLNKIMLSSESLMQIINDILDISKIEAGKMELEKTPFNIQEVITLCETIEGPKADEKGVLLYINSEPSDSQMLLGDPTRLRQILLNLLSNAIKFTNKGMVKLSAIAGESVDGRVPVRFEVKDNGIGMSPEQLHRVFEPFIQADSSTTRNYGGTGLGLAITKNMIELMGGELRVESAPHVGSRFGFTLEFETAQPFEAASTGSDTIADMPKKAVFEGDILICEDNPINQQVITGHLMKLGLNVTTAENGKLGLEAYKGRQGKPFDLIFMDIHMPVMDGLEASKKLTALGNKSPIIALTANAMSKDKETYLQGGMSDYLTKPFTSRDLCNCLMKYLTPVETDEAAASPRLNISHQ